MNRKHIVLGLCQELWAMVVGKKPSIDRIRVDVDMVQRKFGKKGRTPDLQNHSSHGCISWSYLYLIPNLLFRVYTN